MRDQMTAVVLDELDGGRPAGRERFYSILGLVELHGLDVGGNLALGDHPDHGASAWPSRLERLQRPGRRGDEYGCCAHGCGRVRCVLCLALLPGALPCRLVGLHSVLSALLRFFSY